MQALDKEATPSVRELQLHEATKEKIYEEINRCIGLKQQKEDVLHSFQ